MKTMYSYTYGGKQGQRFQLVEAKDLVVIRTKEAAPLSQLSMSGTARELVPALIPVSAFPEANVTVYKCLPMEGRSPVGQRNAVRRALKQEESIRFAGRVLKDPATGAIVVYTENIYLQFDQELPAARCEAIMKEKGLKVKEGLTFAPNAYFVEADESIGLKVFELAAQLLAMPEVQCCHPELVRERKHKFIHPMQWHLKQTVINGMTVNQHANVEAAWALTKGEGITIAVLDDGVDVDHPDFSGPGKVVAPRDTIINSDDARPKHAAERHGTACAGVACANGTGKAWGVAPAARLMPIRVGSIGSISEAKAFQWAADHGADVISCSWGPEDGAWWNPNDPMHFSQARLPDSARAAIEYAVKNGRGGKGCVITWAAGNGNEDVKFDEYASFPKVIAVAACNDRGQRSVYSDFGEAVWCCFPSSDFEMPEFNHPKPLTPGIWTTDRQGSKGYNFGTVNAESILGDMEGNYTATFGGTSSACPGVAGVVALMLSVNPDLSWQQVKELIRHSCDRIDEDMGNYDATGHSPFYGYGRINALKAVKNAKAAANLVPASLDVDVSGSVLFNRTSKQLKEAAGVTAKKQRILGLALEISPPHPSLSIHYQAMIRNIGSSDEASDGKFSGTKDRRRSLTGIRIWLEGDLASSFDVHYEVKLKGLKKWAPYRNGAWAGSNKASKGKTVEGLLVKVTPRDEG